MFFLNDFTNLTFSNKHYGGNAGLKRGVIINNNYWLLKFPQETSTFDNVKISFTTSPLSEYIGSHIYQILGYNAHKTKLGYYYNKEISKRQLVVACEDFTDNDRYVLVDYESIKNNYSDKLQNELIKLNERLPNYKTSGISQHSVKIEEIILQFEMNDLFKQNTEIKDLFWEMLVIDFIINNNDRNKNNWGLLFDKETKIYTPAPIYDNGSSFVTKHNDDKLLGIMSTEEKMTNSVLNGMCYYTIDNKLMNFRNFFKMLQNKKLDNDFNNALKYIKSKIIKHWDEIVEFIRIIPNEEQNIRIISDIQKKFFIDSMRIRINYIFDLGL
ncbi:MAG: CtkA family protein [Erysipelotrichaceae bacterium]|nr:CtkA family protein [Erysipelotrichaceae bacterium]